MILKPMVRNYVCLNAHPRGCELETETQIERIRARAERYAKLSGPKAVLVLGCSTGYGLASRIAAAFGFHAATVGVSFEREPTASKTGTPGFYANRVFERRAREAGLFAASVNGDAFSDAVRAQVIAAAKAAGLRFDLVVYSIASPARTDPVSGTMYRSVIKPIGAPYKGKTVDVFSGRLYEAEAGTASPEEVAETVKVMGGEDWELWIKALESGGALAPGALSLAYSYIGPELSWPIYRDGSIGRAKADLEAAAGRINRAHGGGISAHVSINKAIVSRASAVIPIIPLYVSTLFKVMKERGTHEDCLDQIDRLYRERLYRGPGLPVPTDEEGRIRIDELEMDESVQTEVLARMRRVNEDNLRELADIDGYRSDFLKVHGFAVEGVDYEADVDIG